MVYVQKKHVHEISAVNDLNFLATVESYNINIFIGDKYFSLEDACQG